MVGLMSTWFITGTSSGFGRLMTERLLDRGHSVAATLRRPEVLRDQFPDAKDRLWLAELDVTDSVAVERVVSEAFAHFGVIDVLVNNAGYGTFGAVEELTGEQIRRAIATNLVGSIDVAKAFIPRLRAQGHGRIIQVSSAGGQTAYPGFSAYHASKWGIEGFMEALAAEVAPFNIGVTLAQPGATPTGFTAGRDDGVILEPYDVGPVGDTRRGIANGAFPIPNDPAKIVDAIIDSALADNPPMRLPLGLDTDADLRAAYRRRLEAHDALQETALSVGLD
ncbi:SDR family oxidoreductase [Agreia sp. Leaf244]|uniref:SDR family oxidoreductase n=1 Tax=Agreia sp. Leaf244 TaxID=1736305 RepID=UPI000AA03CAD